MNERQIRKVFPVILSKACLWFLLNFNRMVSENIIQMSRVNEHLCYEFEKGRAHGEGIIDDRRYILLGGNKWLNLDKGYTLSFGQNYSGYPFDYYLGGESLIEGINLSNNTIQPLNGTLYWKTPWSYLRASVNRIASLSIQDALGITDAEYKQAKALGGKWGFSGKWGDKNSLAEGNWHVDNSLLTTDADSNAACFGVCDDKGIPQYPIGLFQTAEGTLLLSWVYLKRTGFFGARRVFFTPEENIAIWGIETIAQPHITDFILCYDSGMLVFYPNGIETTAFGCIPGGVSAVTVSNFSPLCGKRVWPVLVDDQDKDEVEYVIKIAAELRKNRIDFCCVQITGDSNTEYNVLQGKHFCGTRLTNCRITSLSIPELRKLATGHNIPIPDELCADYLGDITEYVNAHEDVPVVPGLFNLGEVVMLNVRDRELTPVLTAHFARSLSSGRHLFPKLWENKKFMTSVFVNDVADENAKYLRRVETKICDTRFIEVEPEERLKNFRDIIGESKIVIFAASQLWKSTEVFRETLRWCRSHNIAAIVLANSENSTTEKTLKYIHGKIITVDRIDGDTGINVAVNAEGVVAVEACFDRNGKLLNAKELSNAKSEQIALGETIPSAPYDDSRLNKVKALPPEEKLAALQPKLGKEIQGGLDNDV